MPGQLVTSGPQEVMVKISVVLYSLVNMLSVKVTGMSLTVVLVYSAATTVAKKAAAIMENCILNILIWRVGGGG